MRARISCRLTCRRNTETRWIPINYRFFTVVGLREIYGLRCIYCRAGLRIINEYSRRSKETRKTTDEPGINCGAPDERILISKTDSVVRTYVLGSDRGDFRYSNARYNQWKFIFRYFNDQVEYRSEHRKSVYIIAYVFEITIRSCRFYRV